MPPQYPSPSGDPRYGQQYNWGAPATPPWPDPVSGGGQPPKKNTGLRWVGGGVVAVAVIVAAAFVLHEYVLTPDATGRTDGAAAASGPPVPNSAMSGLLLTNDAISDIYGLGPMGASKDYSGVVEDTMSGDRVIDQDCNASSPADPIGHIGSPWKTVRRKQVVNKAATDDTKAYLFEAVVGFSDAAAAQKFVDDRTGAWKKCVNRAANLKSVKAEASDPSSFWSVGDVKVDHGTVSKVLTGEGTPGYTCTHVMAPRNNVVIELGACGDGPQPVKKVVDAIAKNIEAAS